MTVNCKVLKIKAEFLKININLHEFVVSNNNNNSLNDPKENMHIYIKNILKKTAYMLSVTKKNFFYDNLINLAKI